ncbi:FAD/NAD(P)-binding oxidoreductase [Pseudarthrobacter sulfonivorans]|uniref:NAD(P)/FAD-dependent oxidoreductase n=1 Tax=Pseudarthrobacter sulfonivorans TaxID=121292 RepID=UPI00168B8566|nr:FAD-dependent oxidoreductase [Pseudarthrobacter sulfonivorans]
MTVFDVNEEELSAVKAGCAEQRGGIDVKNVVIVGAGVAGVRTAERLRSRGFDGRITLLSAEPHLPYDRPPLSKDVLSGDRGLPVLRAEEDYLDLKVELQLARRALGVDTDRRIVHTDAHDLAYDALVIASGAIVRRVPGVDGHVLRTWDDAQRMRRLLGPGVRVGIIGAGLIGCELAASAVALGAEVHLVDILDEPLIRVVGPEFAQIFADMHRARGVHLHMGQAVEAVDPGGISLVGGVRIATDMVVEAIGVIPDVEWLAESGLSLVNGVDCDDAGRASADGVYAVGDVGRWDGSRAEHWSSAVWQADRVAADIVGGAVPEPEIPYWWSDQYDVKLQGVGTIADADEIHIGSFGTAGRPLALYARGGTVIGAVGVSVPNAIRKARNAIKAGAMLEDVRVLLDI